MFAYHTEHEIFLRVSDIQKSAVPQGRIRLFSLSVSFCAPLIIYSRFSLIPVALFQGSGSTVVLGKVVLQFSVLLLPFLCPCLSSCVASGPWRKETWFEKAKAAYMKWVERLVLLEPLSTNSTSCLWTKFRCDHCRNEIESFPFDSGKSITTWGRLLGPEIENIQVS